MGFFSKLFEKKECAICGGEIGLLGNRKLEDGNMCKNCAAKLSPWFSDRRNSTVEEITRQLEYRENNSAELRNFRPTKTFGRYYKLYVEEVNEVPTRFVVSRDGNYTDENADLVKFSDVSDCVVDIREHSEELKRRNDENQMVSYDPPRYRYQYDFYITLNIAGNPYFDEMEFKLNRDSVDIEVGGIGRGTGLGRLLGGGRAFDPLSEPEYREFKQMCDELEKTVECGRKGVANVKFEDALLGAINNLASQGASGAQSAAEEAPRPKFCPECGTPATGGRFCANCGAKL